MSWKQVPGSAGSAVSSRRIGELDDNAITAVARRFAERERERVEALKAQLRDGLKERVASEVARMQDLDCACREAIAGNLDGWFAGMVRSGERAAAGLERLIQGKYQEVAASLMREFRIFTGTNAVALLLLGIAVPLRRRAGLHLLPAAAVVVVSTLIVSGAWLFGQDWLHTIVFADYTGFWFAGYVAIVALSLGDLLFNRARVTSFVLNAVFSVFGAVLSAC